MRSLFYLTRDVLTRRDPVPGVLRKTLVRTLRKAHDQQDAACIQRIEVERQRLLASRESNPAGSKTLAEVCAGSSKKWFWCRLLFNTVRVAGPERCLELGTCLGISAAYQAMALRRNGGGGLVTVEKSRRYCQIAQEVFDNLGLDNIEVINDDFTGALPAILKNNSFDYVFIDGHKSGEALLRYFDMIAEHTASNTVFMLDDIRWSGDMNSAWRSIKQDPRVASSVDLGQMGIVLRA